MIICPSCNTENPDQANFCLECGTRLTREISDEDKPDCPACESGKLTPGIQKGALGIGTKETYECHSCGAIFEENGEKYKFTHIQDKKNPIWKKYKRQTLTTEEWARIAGGGISDAEQKKIDEEKRKKEIKEKEALRERRINEFLTKLGNGLINLKSSTNSPIIPKKNEETNLVMPNVTFLESRAVRQTVGGYGGPSFRVAKGVSFRFGGVSARSESHEELRKIDQGTLLLTNKRLVFIGAKRTINIDLKKIIAIEPYKDGIGSQRENKQKTEYFPQTHKTNLTITTDSQRISIPINGAVLKAAIMGNIARLN